VSAAGLRLIRFLLSFPIIFRLFPPLLRRFTIAIISALVHRLNVARGALTSQQLFCYILRSSYCYERSSRLMEAGRVEQLHFRASFQFFRISLGPPFSHVTHYCNGPLAFSACLCPIALWRRLHHNFRHPVLSPLRCGECHRVSNMVSSRVKYHFFFANKDPSIFRDPPRRSGNLTKSHLTLSGPIPP